MADSFLAGSAWLQAAFYGLAALILIAASVLVRSAARRCGDSAGAAAALQRRFHLGAAAWVGGVSAASYAGAFVPRGDSPLPFLVLFAGIVTLGIAVARSAVGDRLARGLPLSVLVGFQAFRLPLELAMHRAFTEGLMPVQMSYAGLNFDIVTGATALGLGAALAVTRVPTWVVRAWNGMGLLLLINIAAIAMVSSPAVQLFGPDRVNVWVTRMPYTLLPAVIVLAAWAGHLIVWRALSLRAAATPGPR